MADQYYTVPKNPQYSENIRKIQNSDPVNADMTVNPVVEALMENTAAIKATADAAKTAASTAQTAADAAKAAASTAQTTADAAKTTADAAKTAASTAQTTADAAKTAASTAQTAADAAKTAASTAQTTANTAKTTADAAKTAASTAQTTANGRVQIQTGTYTGNTSQYTVGSQTIVTSFTPKAVLVFQSGLITYASNAIDGGIAFPNNPLLVQNADIKIIEIVNNGFMVYNSEYSNKNMIASANVTNALYYFIAFG